jgi:GH25 family lysozyme M1 (1,4-beta-N-acetylmuramidase)
LNPEYERTERGENRKKSVRTRKRTGNLVAIIFLSVICLVALSFCVFLMLRIEVMKDDEVQMKTSVDRLNNIESAGYITNADALQRIQDERAQAEQEATDTLLEYIRSSYRNGNSSVWMLRNLFGTFANELVVGSGGSFYFFPIDDTLKKALVSPMDMQPDSDGRMRYVGADPSVAGTLGVDVSRFQGKINWEKVAADGVKFTFIRVGARGSTEGKIIEDNQFEANIEGALENGLDVGVYFYTQAINEAEAIEEAEYVIEALKPYTITLPVVFDFEPADTDDARTNDLSIEQNTANVLAFCSRVSEAGYTPMLYGGLKSFLMMLDTKQIEPLKKWFAFYDDTMYYPYEYSYWQYTAQGRVNGIEGDVDLDICIENLAR